MSLNSMAEIWSTDSIAKRMNLRKIHQRRHQMQKNYSFEVHALQRLMPYWNRAIAQR